MSTLKPGKSSRPPRDRMHQTVKLATSRAPQNDGPVEPALSEAEVLEREGEVARALLLYLDVAAGHEIPPAELSLKVSRCYERLGSTKDAILWLNRVVDATDSFLAWTAAGAALARLTRETPPAARRHCRLAITGSYTLTQLASMLPLAASRIGIDLTAHESLYGQYQQDLIDPTSDLYRWDPDQILIAVHEGAVQLPAFSDKPRAHVEEEAARWRGLWDMAANHSNAAVIQHSFALRPESVVGHLGSGLRGSRDTMLQALNQELAQRKSEHVSIVDCDRLAANFGRERWFDDRYWFRSRQAVALEALPVLARHTAAVIAARLGLTRKCLVLDLDNTLWGGVVGEDGLAHLKLGGDAIGEAFAAFQEYLLALKDRGVLLAVASKNNPTDAREVFERHPEMRLKLDDISAFMVNWQDKASNLQRIAETLGIGLDALVLVDDNPAERQLVRTLLPEVDVVALPPNPAQYRRSLSDYLGFETVAVTTEDKQRTAHYRARLQAAELAGAAPDISTFLHRLGMKAITAPFDDLHLARIAQLCGKTNQFNLTTRRHTATELSALATSPNHVTRYLQLSDRLTAHGLVALMIADIRADALDIDTLLLSCRVIGRTVEAHLLAELCRSAERLRRPKLRGTYIPTAKNAIVRDLYKEFGFTLVDERENGVTSWEYDLRAQEPIVSPFIQEDQK